MNNKTEIIANITLIVIGLTLGILFFLNGDKDLSIILFSIALACILYQFLGGVGDENSFQLGAIKFGGTAAILIGFMFFIKQFIFVPTPEEYRLTVSPEKDWLPVSAETGRIRDIRISSGADKRVFPGEGFQDYVDKRKKHEYQLSGLSGSSFSIELRSHTSDTIGFIDLHNIKASGLFNTSKITTRRVQVFTLYPDDETMNSTNKLANIDLPFEIKVFNTSRFSIEPYYINEEVIRRTSWLIPYSENITYIAILEQARSTGDDIFSKWLVERIEHKLE